jgi:4-diphosphocytidyl-2-C-methyl-D-erythritol kinase
VSGSGPTVAFLAHNPAAAEGLANDLRHHSFDAMAVHGPVHGARIISDTLL